MLEVESLACLKGDRLLFRDLAFRLQAGGLLRVAGPNGVGKTSLLRLVTGLALPEAGEIRWRGESIRRAREAFHGDLLYLGHAAALNDLLSPLENLRFACAAAGDAVDAEDCVQALQRIGHLCRRHRPDQRDGIGQQFGGHPAHAQRQRQRAARFRAVARCVLVWVFLTGAELVDSQRENPVEATTAEEWTGRVRDFTARKGKTAASGDQPHVEGGADRPHGDGAG